jgi:hypothetical protein
MNRPRPELSGVQVVATVLAALTGAILASSLGVVGTVAGTAIASAASTTATAIYRHYLGRGKERFHKVAPVIKKRAYWWDGAQGASAGKTTEADAKGTAAFGQGADSPATASPATVDPKKVAAEAQTRLDRAITPPTVPTFTAARVPTFTPNGKSAAQTPDAPTAQEMPAIRETVNGETTAESISLASRLRTWRELLWNRRVLIRYWIPAITVFILVMGGITAFELVAGKPISAAVWGKTGSGTTIGSVFGGSSSPKTKQPSTGSSTSTGQATTAPSTTPSPSTSPSGAAVTPTPTTSTGANANTGADSSSGADSNPGADDSTPSTSSNAG